MALTGLLAVAWPGAPTQAKVGGTTIAKLVQQADLVVVARVEAVETLDGLPVARVVPKQILKGPASHGPLYLVAGPTWTCDVSEAVAGETALLFLNRAPSQTVSRGNLRLSEVRVPRRPLHVITHAGSGRMPIWEVEGKAYAGVSGDIALPARLIPRPSRSSEELSFQRSVRLPQLVAEVRRVLAKQPTAARPGTPMRPNR